MSPEAQQIAIAEACGWTDVRKTAFGLLGCHPKADLSVLSDEYLCARPIPDYLHDLNACHEAVKTLPQNLKPRYFAYLCAIVSGAISLHGYAEATEATAAQRCEAFLKTLDKWTNDN